MKYSVKKGIHRPQDTKIKDLLAAADVTQMTAAHDLGWSISKMSRTCNGTYRLKDADKVKLAKYLEIEPCYLA